VRELETKAHAVSLALFHSNEGDTAQEYLAAHKKTLDRAESLSEGIVSARYNVMLQEMTNRLIVANVPKQIDKSLSKF
jgi:hypothetical protein